MSTVRQDEFALAAQHLRCAVTGLPGRDVIGDAADDEGVDIDLAEIDRLSKDHLLAGIGEGLRLVEREIVGMKCRREIGRVVVPEENVEGRRLLAVKIIVHDIVPDEIVRPEPGEDARQIGTGENAFLGGSLSRHFDAAFRDQHADIAVFHARIEDADPEGD